MRNAALGNFQARRFFSGRYLAESNRRERICSPVHSHFAKVPRCVLSVKVRQRYQEFSALPNEVRRVSCRSVFGSGALCVFWRLWLPRGEGLRKEGYPSLNKASFGGCREIQTETISSVCIFFLFHTDRGDRPGTYQKLVPDPEEDGFGTDFVIRREMGIFASQIIIKIVQRYLRHKERTPSPCTREGKKLIRASSSPSDEEKRVRDLISTKGKLAPILKQKLVSRYMLVCDIIN